MWRTKFNKAFNQSIRGLKNSTLISISIGWSKILLFTVFVLVAAIVSIGIQIGKNQMSNQLPTTVQPTTSPTQIGTNPTGPTDSIVNWTNYINSKYNFSFKYPSDFKNKIIDGGNTLLSASNQNYWLTLKVDSDLDKYAKEIKDIRQLFDAKALNVNIKNIEPYTVYLQSMQTAGGEFSFFRTVIIPTNFLVIEFSLSPRNENDFASAEKIADQILSTFKFSK